VRSAGWLIAALCGCGASSAQDDAPAARTVRAPAAELPAAGPAGPPPGAPPLSIGDRGLSAMPVIDWRASRLPLARLDDDSTLWLRIRGRQVSIVLTVRWP
jgi:hypothetical protein